jgi:uncharacterized protein (TIGR02145 family)
MTSTLSLTKKNMALKIPSQLIVVLLFLSCHLNAQSFVCGSTISDIDGNIYNTVAIGNQCWTVENMRSTRCGTGTSIPLVSDTLQWSTLAGPAYSYYGNEIGNAGIYGLLYNGYAATDTCNVCPEGWHVPDDGEWSGLVSYLGGEGVAGGPMKEVTGWNGSNTGATNSSGFTAKPGGFRLANGEYDYLGAQARFWTSSMATAQNAWSRVLYFNDATVARLNYHRRNGMSLRCIKSQVVALTEPEAFKPVKKIFPNPAQNFVTIELRKSGNAELWVTEGTGGVLYHVWLPSAQDIQIETGQFSNGLYFIVLKTEGGMQTIKFAVAR